MSYVSFRENIRGVDARCAAAAPSSPSSAHHREVNEPRPVSGQGDARRHAHRDSGFGRNYVMSVPRANRGVRARRPIHGSRML